MGCSCDMNPSQGLQPARDAAWEALEHYYCQAAQDGRVGMIPRRLLEACNALWGADPVTVAPGATETITWPTANVYFDMLAPVALILTVHDAGANAAVDPSTGAFTQTLRTCQYECLLSIESIEYGGNQRLSSAHRVNLDTFRCCDQVLSLACLGPIRVGGNQPVVTVRSEIDPASPGAFPLHVQGTIVGWEVRGSRLYSPRGSYPCDVYEMIRECQQRGIPIPLPPGTGPKGGDLSVDAQVNVKYTARPKRGGGGGGTSTAPGSSPPVP